MAGGILGVAAIFSGPVGWAALGLTVASTGTKIGNWIYNMNEENVIENFKVDKAL